MKLLVITNLFPNRHEPTRGMYNRQQIAALSKLCELKVIAPVPWAPPLNLTGLRFDTSNLPARETIDGIEVFHPRYFMIPKVGRSLYGLFLFLSLFWKVRALQRKFPFDALYAPWVYPDGFGSFLIARLLRKPVVICALGSDINLSTKHLVRRKLIAFCLRHCDRAVAVSNALKKRMMEIGVPGKHVAVIPNGVDCSLFKPMIMDESRKRLGIALDTKMLLFIGNLVPVKGVSYLLKAFSRLRVGTARLFIVGDGPLRTELSRQAQQLGIGDSVVFAGKQPHQAIPLWMNACDVFCLPSLNEGMPNVVLEALACGKPVVATCVGGIPEIIVSDEQGILVPPGKPDSMGEALNRALTGTQRVKPETLRGIMGWDENAKMVFDELCLTMQC